MAVKKNKGGGGETDNRSAFPPLPHLRWTHKTRASFLGNVVVVCKLIWRKKSRFARWDIFIPILAILTIFGSYSHLMIKMLLEKNESINFLDSFEIDVFSVLGYF